MADPLHTFKSNLRRRSAAQVSDLLQHITDCCHDDDWLETTGNVDDDNTDNDDPDHDDFFDASDSDFYRDCDDFDDDDNDAGEESVKHDLADDLVDWALKYNITMVALTALLSILKVHHPNLPKDARTLLKTMTDYRLQALAGGIFFYFGILNGMTHLLESAWSRFPDRHYFLLQLNFDGLPLFNSNSKQLWPILGLVRDLDTSPFMIAVFGGETKPKSLTEYLSDLVRELNSLRSGFNFKGKVFFLKVCSIVCDAPARAFVKGIKGHSGYSSCDKCSQSGIYIRGRMTFPLTNAPLRTDHSFRLRSDEDHHVAQSLLTETSIDMVLDFPHDYMHLVCLGVVRRLFDLWCGGPLRTRLSGQLTRSLSHSLQQLKTHIPCEFARKPRAFEERGRWKATELRQFLLYTGPVVLVDVLSPPVYNNFMLLSVAVYILANPKVSVGMCDFAKSLLVSFVEHFGGLYGEEYLVFNVHGLIHLSDDVKRHGCLDNISCFPFENFLCEIKELVRGPICPVAQIVRRISERANKRDCDIPTLEHVLRKEHTDGPLPQGARGVIQEFKEMQLQKFCIKVTEGDNGVKIENDIGLVKNIILNNGDVYIVYSQFLAVDPFYNYPLDSSRLGVCRLSQLSSHLKCAKVDKSLCKYVLLPFKDHIVGFPLLHADESLSN